MILDILSSYKKLASYDFENINNDDFYDKLSRKFSAIMMIVLTTILSVYQLVGKPLQCWCHNEYSGSRCEYASSYCYLTSFHVPVGNNTILPKREELESNRILYYQWVAYIFLFMAFLFYFPSMIWTYLSSSIGFDLKNYIRELKKDNSEGQKDAARYVAAHIIECNNFRQSYLNRGTLKKITRRVACSCTGSLLTASLFLVKFSYALIALTQMFILNYWFRNDHYRNLNKMSFFFGEHNWRLEERFPRMTLCKFQVYILNDQQTHWVQCTLPINIYLEKMYLIVWIWSFVLFFLTVFNMLRYAYFCVHGKKRFISEYVNGSSNIDDLNADTLIVLKLIKENTSSCDVRNVVETLNYLYSNE